MIHDTWVPAAALCNEEVMVMTQNELARLVEMSEARAYRSLVTSLPDDVSARYGFRANPMGEAVAVMAD